LVHLEKEWVDHDKRENKKGKGLQYKYLKNNRVVA
jgi:hypothetical protein